MGRGSATSAWRARSGRLLLWLAVALVLAMPLAASAADVVKPSGPAVELEVSKGRMITLARAAASVFIADPEIADIQVKSPTLVYVLGKRAGATTLFAVDGGGRVLASLDVTVSYNVIGLRQAIETAYPGLDVQAGTAHDGLVLDGSVATAAQAEEIRRLAERFAPGEGAVINRLRIEAPTQVNLRVRVAEVSNNVDKQFGFRWNTIAGVLGGVSFGVATANPFRSNVTPDTLSLRWNPSRLWDFNAVIDAMEQEGLVTVLAEPNLTAMSGETASFLAGGEFPILVPDSDGRVTIEFKQFGVSLAFTPTLLGERVNLHVRPEVSQLSSTNSVTLNNFVVPSLTTRRAETTVELASGQSFAIAGLLKNNITQDIQKFPGLGDLPVLGGLFRSDRFQRNESELVIIVTPYLVRPVPGKLATPVDGLQPPHDIERLLGGGTYRQAPEAGRPSGVVRERRGLVGPVGFEQF